MYANYDYYRIFYYVARYGGVSQAAKVLSADQPNLTRAVKNLESALGCPLFARSRRGMTLTPEGEKLYAHVRIAFEHIERSFWRAATCKAARSLSPPARWHCAGCCSRC